MVLTCPCRLLFTNVGLRSEAPKLMDAAIAAYATVQPRTRSLTEACTILCTVLHCTSSEAKCEFQSRALAIFLDSLPTWTHQLVSLRSRRLSDPIAKNVGVGNKPPCSGRCSHCEHKIGCEKCCSEHEGCEIRIPSIHPAATLSVKEESIRPTNLP